MGRHEMTRSGRHGNDQMETRRDVYASVVGRLKRDGLLSRGGRPLRADMVWALTSWQLWKQLVVDQGWSKERKRKYLPPRANPGTRRADRCGIS